VLNHVTIAQARRKVIAWRIQLRRPSTQALTGP